MRHLEKLLFLATLLTAGTGSAACTVSATPVDFGSCELLYGCSTVGTIDVSCDGGETPLIHIDAGVNSGGNFFPRRLGPSPFIEYNLYTDALYLFVWGDGTSGTSTVQGPGTFQVFGSIPPPQYLPPPGTYDDTLLTTVNL